MGQGDGILVTFFVTVTQYLVTVKLRRGRVVISAHGSRLWSAVGTAWRGSLAQLGTLGAHSGSRQCRRSANSLLGFSPRPQLIS